MKLWQPWGRAYEACGRRMTLNIFKYFAKKRLIFSRASGQKKKKRREKKKNIIGRNQKRMVGWLLKRFL